MMEAFLAPRDKPSLPDILYMLYMFSDLFDQYYPYCIILKVKMIEYTAAPPIACPTFNDYSHQPSHCCCHLHR
jgi:hypothetical protein